MIDRTAIVKLALVPAIVCLAGTGVAAWVRSVDFAAGILLGGSLGLAPFLSWAWLMGNLHRRAVVFGVLAGKLALYGGVLYLLVTREVVSAFGVFLGITAVLFLYTIAAMVRLSIPRETAS